MNEPTPDVADDPEQGATVARLAEALQERAEAGPPPDAAAAWDRIAAGPGTAAWWAGRRAGLLAVAAAAAVLVASAVVVSRARGTDPELGTFSPPSTATAPPTTGPPGTAVAATTTAPPPDDDAGTPASATLAPGPTAPATTVPPPGVVPPEPTPAPTVSPPTSGPPSPAAPTSTTPPAPATSVRLSGNGLGVATFGQEASTALAALEGALGPPDGDSGWQGPGLWTFPVRSVHWGSLDVLFADRDGDQRLVGWSYRSPASRTFPLAGGLTLGLPVAELERLAPQPVTARGLQGSTGLCFEDNGTVCATLDPPWQRAGRPDQGTVAAYTAGLAVTG